MVKVHAKPVRFCTSSWNFGFSDMGGGLVSSGTGFPYLGFGSLQVKVRLWPRFDLEQVAFSFFRGMAAMQVGGVST